MRGLSTRSKEVNATDSMLLRGTSLCLQRGVNALSLTSCSRAQFLTQPWQDRQFSWLRTLCWNGNPEHQVSGHHSKPYSLLLLLSKEGAGNHPGSFAECFQPLQRTVSLLGMVSLRLRLAKSSLGAAMNSGMRPGSPLTDPELRAPGLTRQLSPP